MLKRLVAACLALAPLALAQASLVKGAPPFDGPFNACRSEPVCLVPTLNQWTFIELDTRDGTLWQVQYGLKPAEQFKVEITGSRRVALLDTVRALQAARQACTAMGAGKPANSALRAKFVGPDGKPTRGCVAAELAIIFPGDPTLHLGHRNAAGRFLLYPTKNIFNLLLLDTATGDVWQVQWSEDNSQRFVLHLGEAAGTAPVK